MQALLTAILTTLHASDGMVEPALIKRLNISMSELRRALVLLGDDPVLAGLGLVRIEQIDGRRRLWLTEKGRALCTSEH